jgi:hypothetical protein
MDQTIDAGNGRQVPPDPRASYVDARRAYLIHAEHCEACISFNGVCYDGHRLAVDLEALARPIGSKLSPVGHAVYVVGRLDELVASLDGGDLDDVIRWLRDSGRRARARQRSLAEEASRA